MPNWCENNLYISHEDPVMLEKARDAWNSGKFLGTLIPEPDYKTTPVKKTFPEISAQYAKTEEEKQKALENAPTIREDSWWDWRVQNWGTKWDIGKDDDLGIEAKIENGVIFVCFNSAWSPPVDAYYKLDEMGYTIKAYYHEGGCAFCGCFDEGIDDTYDIDLDPNMTAEEWLTANIPQDIIDEMGLIDSYDYWEEQRMEMKGEDYES